MRGRRRFFARCVCAGAAILAAAACTSVPQASDERDAAAKQFNTHPNAAAIYVYRTDFGSNDSQWTDSVLWVDNRLIGSTLPLSFFRLDLQPGKHLLRGEGADTGRLEIDTKAGELHFVSLTVVGSTSVFRQVPVETGKRDLLRCCTMMENWAPGQRPLLR